MHILLIHQAFASPKDVGGTRHYEMAKEMAANGHKITIIGSDISYLTCDSASEKDMDSDFITESISILRAYTPRFIHRNFLYRLIALIGFMISSFWTGIRVRDVDLVWATSPQLFQAFTSMVIAKLRRVPLLVEIRDLWPAFAVALGVIKDPIIIRMANWLEKLILSNADKVIVNSPGYINHVQSKTNAPVYLIPNGVDPSMFDPTLDGKAFREKYGLQDDFIVMYAGAHGYANYLDLILEAAQLTKDEPKIKYVFVGDGKEKKRLIKVKQENNLENVCFLDPVMKMEMKHALAAADVCIATLMPIELFKTTYPNKVFDYLAAGKPILLCIDGVIREVVEKAKAGIFVPPGDSKKLAEGVINLAKHETSLREIGLNGREYVEKNFNRSDFTKSFMKIVETMR